MMTIQKLKTLYLGRQGESNITIINVDVSSWLTEYPNGTITLMLMRPSEKAAYPVVGTVTNNVFSYTVKATDTAFCGGGLAEFRLTKNNQIKKSKVVGTEVEYSITAETTPPSGAQPWVDQVLAAAATVETATIHAPMIDATNSHWLVWSMQNNAYVDTGVNARGIQGETGPAGPTGATGATGTDGYSPTATVTKAGAVTTISITDKNGTTTQTVTDAPQIDDAHTYATNPWSGQKVSNELASKASASHTHTKSQITDFPSIPSKTSDLTNDSGFLTEHQSLAAYRTSAAQDTIDSGKVDKITGKGLSTEDYSTSEKSKLAGIETGADVTDATNVAAAGALMTNAGVAHAGKFMIVNAQGNIVPTTMQAWQGGSY